ncbi:small nuclear ribonucleoprotein D2 [Strigomonas culicis]|uniref:Small nuclear ribonucleoprotein Sm D2 n=1 Tax=Strigomonas culicis TaxID=28005 RepID=S9USE8_9TRYP|nr:small nuclear ribonucleoprotein D2 [Strigomonas culicis]|eukprot:EPY31709.1 small nuclear ribonucleoprotein D2 [Strigomonas culicis]
MSDSVAANKHRRDQISSAKDLQTPVSKGPFSVLDSAMKEETRVFVQCRFNKSLICTVVAFDKHFNLVLRDVTELSGNSSDNNMRTLKNVFLRGESVIFVVKMGAE